jgi:hypothetical protein
MQSVSPLFLNGSDVVLRAKYDVIVQSVVSGHAGFLSHPCQDARRLRIYLEKVIVRLPNPFVPAPAPGCMLIAPRPWVLPHCHLVKGVVFKTRLSGHVFES